MVKGEMGGKEPPSMRFGWQSHRCTAKVVG